jgi:hypothetical protein
MFGSTVLDVGLGVILVFLLISFIATALREAIESWRKARAAYLEKGILELLGGSSASDLAKSFYDHPLIYALYRGEYSPQEATSGIKGFFLRNARELFMPRGRSLPTYIPAKNFAGAIIDLAVRGPFPSDYASAQTQAEVSVVTIRANAGQLTNPRLIRAVLAATDFANGDVSKVRDNLQDWFDSSMDRVSGWYKRATQVWLFGIGLLLAAILNINTFRIADGLWRDKSLRDAIAARTEAMARDTTYQRLLVDTTYRKQDLRQAMLALTALNLPIGWSDVAKKEARDRSDAGGGSFWSFWLLAFSGYLLTAFAVTLGAPFWFDVLNKFMVIRSTVKPHEKSPEESSEDRQKAPKLSTPASGTATVAAGLPTSVAAVPTTPAAGSPQPSLQQVPKIDADFVERQWKPAIAANSDEGVI